MVGVTPSSGLLMICKPWTFLGKGSFSSVFEATLTNHQSSFNHHGNDRNQKTYAIKCIKTNRSKDKSYIIDVASALRYEARILSNLQHKNIIRLEAVSSLPAIESSSSHGGYFLVLERLVDVLDDRLNRWRDAESRQRFSSKHRILGSHSKPWIARPSRWGRRHRSRTRFLPSQLLQESPFDRNLFGSGHLRHTSEGLSGCFDNWVEYDARGGEYCTSCRRVDVKKERMKGCCAFPKLSSIIWFVGMNRNMHQSRERERRTKMDTWSSFITTSLLSRSEVNSKILLRRIVLK